MSKLSALSKKLKTLKAKEWDIETDINWTIGIDLSKPFLPLGEGFSSICKFTEGETLALSQAIGILSMSAISEHEQVLNSFKESAWMNQLNDEDYKNGFFELGEQFFKEEEKHSKAFLGFLKSFAVQTETTFEALSEYLPSYKENSLCSKLFKLNLKLGGQAIWWAIATTEAESIEIYRSIAQFKKVKEMDPLFTQIHRLHFEEEMRHKSYAFMMLERMYQRSHIINRIFSKLDYVTSHLIEVLWVFLQLSKFSKIENSYNTHHFYKNLASALKKIKKLSLTKKLKLLFKGIPYISIMFKLNRHKAVIQKAQELKSLGAFAPSKSFIFPGASYDS